MAVSSLDLPVEGRLPALDGAKAWLNSAPLTPEGLRGRVVLVEFWTFTCINWIRTLPHVRAWWKRYATDGLAVIGVHTPEFAVEHDLDNVQRAAAAMNVDFPIAIDNDYAIWSAFENQYWPALYFVDAQGQIRHHRFGEGEYARSEAVIRELLIDAGVGDLGPELGPVDGAGVEAAADWEDLRTPETYVGYARAENLASPGGIAPDKPHAYTAPAGLTLNQWALAGEWTVHRQPAVLGEPGGRIVHRFHARDLHLVMGAGAREEPVRFRVLMDGVPPGGAHGLDVDEQGHGTVGEPRLYQLIRQQDRVTEHTFEITFLEPGAHAYVFTFG